MSQRLTPGEQAPDFTLTDAAGEEVTLSGLRGRRVIVYFYPKASTPGCTTQACDFQDRLAFSIGEGEVGGLLAGGQSLGHGRDSLVCLRDRDRARRGIRRAGPVLLPWSQMRAPRPARPRATRR